MHLEFDRHDIVLAESLSADSRLDTGTRTEFEGGSVLTMYPTFAAMAHDMACRRLMIAGPEVEAAQAALAHATMQNRESFIEAVAPPRRLAGG